VIGDSKLRSHNYGSEKKDYDDEKEPVQTAFFLPTRKVCLHLSAASFA